MCILLCIHECIIIIISQKNQQLRDGKKVGCEEGVERKKTKATKTTTTTAEAATTARFIHIHNQVKINTREACVHMSWSHSLKYVEMNLFASIFFGGDFPSKSINHIKSSREKWKWYGFALHKNCD